MAAMAVTAGGDIIADLIMVDFTKEATSMGAPLLALGWDFGRGIIRGPGIIQATTGIIRVITDTIRVIIRMIIPPIMGHMTRVIPMRRRNPSTHRAEAARRLPDIPILHPFPKIPSLAMRVHPLQRARFRPVNGDARYGPLQGSITARAV